MIYPNLLKKICRLKSSAQEQGFTLAEVLVAILIVSLFIATSMQAMVYAAYFQVRARQYAEATTWIQEDLERVKSEASQLTPDNTKCNPSPGNQDEGYAHYLRTSLPDVDEPPSGDQNTGTKTIAGKTYTLYRDGPDDNDSTIRPNVSNTFPYNVMQVKYEVKPQDSNDVIAKIYTEVIPDAAFKCP